MAEVKTSTSKVMMKKVWSMRSHVGKVGKAAGAIGAGGGAGADFARPLGPWLLLGAVVVVLITALAGYMWFSKKKKSLDEELESGAIDVEGYNEKASKNLFVNTFAYGSVISVVLCLFLGAYAFAGDKKRGLLASKITPLQRIQNTLFSIQKDVKEIKRDVKDIKDSNTRIEKGIQGIVKNLKGLQTNGGIITAPTTAEHFYHNARMYELRADRGSARKSYAKYLEFDSKYIDPHVAYQRILKDTDGLSSTRKTYRALKAKYPENPAVQLAYAMLLEGKERLRTMKQLLTKYPNYLPLIGAIATLYSAVELGSQTASDRANELKFLTMWKNKGGPSDHLSFYLDKRVGEIELKRLQTMFNMYDKNAAVKAMAKNPVRVTGQQVGPGNFTLSFVIMDSPQEILYKLEGMSDFKSTGTMGIKNPVTGKSMPKMFLNTAKLKVGVNRVEVRYRDAKGVMQGPVVANVTIQSTNNRAADSFINVTWGLVAMKKIGVKKIAGQTIVFANWLNDPSIFTKVSYSLNSDSLNQVLIRNGKGKKMFKISSRAKSITLYMKGDLVNGKSTGIVKYKFSPSKRMQFFSPEE